MMYSIAASDLETFIEELQTDHDEVWEHLNDVYEPDLPYWEARRKVLLGIQSQVHVTVQALKELNRMGVSRTQRVMMDELLTKFFEGEPHD